MSKSQLVERIEALPRDKASQVEALVAALEREAPPVQFPHQLLDEITAFRENLRASHGTFPDSCAVIRELRETGL